MTNNLTTNWTANSTTPLYDSDYTNGSRPAIYFDANYPSTDYTEPDMADQRFVGGPGADDLNDGTQGTPWATLDKAFQELCASSTWYCLNFGGNLTEGTGFDTKAYGSGPGTSGQFAILRGDPSLPSKPVLTINAACEVDGQDFWLWHDFDMAGTNGFLFAEDLATINHTMRNITGTMTGLGGDNIGHFYSLNQNLDYWGVFNCNFTGPGVGGGIHGNTGALVTFRTRHLRWENNEVTNYPRPLYYKHSNRAVDGSADVHIRRNYQYETTAGEACFFGGRAEGGTWEMTDNIFESNVEISNGGGGEQPNGMTIEHNTFVADLGLETGNDPVINSTIRNNIIGTDLEILRFGVDTNTNTTNYNLYGGTIYYQSTAYTLSEWQAASEPAGQDVNSIAGSPTYSTEPPTQISHYELAGGSDGKNAASDGEDMGANVSVVGNL